MITHKKETLIRTRTHCMNLYSHEKAVQSLDINGSIIDVSPAWLELTGFAKKEVTGKHFMEFLHADSLLCVEKNFPYLKNFGYVDNVQLKIRTKDNRALSVSLTGTSRYDDNGMFERTFCELTLNTPNDSGSLSDIDDFIDEMDEYLDRLGRLLNRKVQGLAEFMKSAFPTKS